MNNKEKIVGLFDSLHYDSIKEFSEKLINHFEYMKENAEEMIENFEEKKDSFSVAWYQGNLCAYKLAIQHIKSEEKINARLSSQK